MNIIKQILKIILSGLIALFILCAISYFYYRAPMYHTNPFGNTDFSWPANSTWCKMVEGISYGQFDAQGFNNREAYRIADVVLVGSSHMEATYIPQDQTICARLEVLSQHKMKAYNMGISGNTLIKSLQYLPETLEVLEEPPKLVLIEANSVEMTEEDVQNILNHTVPSIFKPRPAAERSIRGLPYLRLLAHQKNVGLMDLLFPVKQSGQSDAVAFHTCPEIIPADSGKGAHYDPVFQRLTELREQYGTEFLIFYDSCGQLEPDGKVHYCKDPWIEVFAKKCRENNVGFLDLTEAFEKLYREEKKLPNGFTNGRIGNGHLNADGHRVIAEAIYNWMTENREGL